MVVGFDEGEDVGAFGDEGGDDGEDFGLFGPADVDGDELRLFGEFDVKGVGAVFDGDARVFAEGPGEDAVGGVDAVDFCGAVLEEAVGEAADVGAEVGAGFGGGVDGEGGEGGFQLQTGA